MNETHEITIVLTAEEAQALADLAAAEKRSQSLTAVGLVRRELTERGFLRGAEVNEAQDRKRFVNLDEVNGNTHLEETS